MVSVDELVCGPILRRVSVDSANVWLALGRSAEVEVAIFDEHERLVHGAKMPTVAIGEALHIAMLCTSSHDGRKLRWGHTYTYEVRIDGEPLDVSELLYAGGPPRPSFALPTTELSDARIWHGSCRHPTKDGPDALCYLDSALASFFAQDWSDGERADSRPDLFVCTGDLVYADTPSKSFVSILSQVGDELLGYKEILPILECTSTELSLSQRKKAARKHAAIPDACPRQLFSFGEFLAIHLMSLSPSLWKKRSVPSDMRQFVEGLGHVRRALANTPFYAIFDDHEVTDDWFLTRHWSEEVTQSPLGMRMICNGLSAFALIHSWGNSQQQFAQGKAGARIVEELVARRLGSPLLQDLLSARGGLDSQEERNNDSTGPAEKLTWNFRVPHPCLNICALDTRTQREYPADDEYAIPNFLPDRAARRQIPLEELSSANPLVLAVSAPMAPPPRSRTLEFFGWLSTLCKKPFAGWAVRNVYVPDRGDEWQPESESFAELVAYLPSPWVCLGGDTHISYSASLFTEGAELASVAVYCSSGMKRQSRLRKWCERIGYDFPWPRFMAGPMPVCQGKGLSMRYGSGEDSTGKRLEYLAQNSIGELRFVHKKGQLVSRHAHWFRRDGSELLRFHSAVALSSASEMAGAGADTTSA